MSSIGPDRLRDRAGVARVVLAGAFLLLLGAFFRAQILGHEEYRLKAEQNRLRQVPLLAPRGAILDRNGEIIADNIPGYTVKLFAGQEDSLRAVLSRIAQLVPVDSGGIETIVGMTDASMTRSASMPRMRSRASTTAAASVPMRQVPTG